MCSAGGSETLSSFRGLAVRGPVWGNGVRYGCLDFYVSYHICRLDFRFEYQEIAGDKQYNQIP